MPRIAAKPDVRQRNDHHAKYSMSNTPTDGADVICGRNPAKIATLVSATIVELKKIKPPRWGGL